MAIEVLDRREPRGRADDGRQLGPAAGRCAAARSSRPRREDLDDEEAIEVEMEDEEEEEEAEARGSRAPEGERPGRRRRRRRRGGRGRGRREGGEADEAGEPAKLAKRACARSGRREQPGGCRAGRRTAAEEPREGGRRRRRRRGRGGAGEARSASSEPRSSRDSSPMVERPIDEEPPIAETEPARRAAAGTAPASGAGARRLRPTRRGCSRSRAGAGRSSARPKHRREDG